MPTRMLPITVLGPGWKGLNTQNIVSEDPTFAIKATNCVIDTSGRLAARKGWTAITSTPIGSTPDVDKIYEHIDAEGTSTIISSANNVLYSGTTTLTSILGSLTPSTDNWKFQRFNGKVVGWADGEAPIVWTGTGNFAAITAAGSGTVPNGEEVLSAFGRLWATSSATDKTLIRYSDILDETTWDDSASPGDSGSLDMLNVQGWGQDTVVAIREHNNFLVVFGKRNIAIYKGAWNPNNTGLSHVDAEFELVDIISGTGAYSRDTVVSIGTDIIFLSDSGVRSLQRTIQEKSLPMTEISKNVRDDLLINLGGETDVTVEMEFSEAEGFILLNMKTSGIIYVFDVRAPLQDGSYRTTKWENIEPTAMYAARDGTLYLGQAGVVAKYDSYQDDATAYFLDFRSSWFSLTDEAQNKYKIPKSARALVFAGGGYDLNLRTFYDYSDQYSQATTTIPAGGVSEFGIAEFGEDEFNSLGDNNELDFNPIGFGRTLQFGFYVQINGNAFGVHRLIYLIKLGREA